MDAAPEFPLGDTLDAGTWRVFESLRRGGSQDLCLAERTRGADAGARAMVSVVWAPRGIPLPELRPCFEVAAPGVLELEYVGAFDEVAPPDDVRAAQQRQHVALVERLPEPDGDPIEWLPRANPVVGPGAAVSLGRSTGAILARAAASGSLLVGLRPEYIWVQNDGKRLVATGLTARNREFFALGGGRCMAPGMTFERHYYAPEVYLGRGEQEESLVFTLSVLVAEWATGAFPFPDARVGGDMRSLLEGRHAPLDLPPALASLLERGLRPDPAARPRLAAFLDELSRSAASARP